MSQSKLDLWMPFYVGDYLRDTMHLTTEQHGAYVLLLLHYWVKGGPLPDNDTYLASVAKLHAELWLSYKPSISAFFKIGGGQWIHGRVEAELAERARIQASRSKGGKMTANKRFFNQGQLDLLPVADAEQVAQLQAKLQAEQVAQPLAEQVALVTQSQSHIDLRSIDRFCDDIYQAYPRKVGKPAALKAIARALSLITPEFAEFAPEWLLGKVKAYSAEVAGADMQFIPHPATWFNQQRYNDDPQTWRPGSQASSNRGAAKPGIDRNAGTLNEQHTGDYANIGKLA